MGAQFCNAKTPANKPKKRRYLSVVFIFMCVNYLEMKVGVAETEWIVFIAIDGNMNCSV
jgi:hypothetical protein